MATQLAIDEGGLVPAVVASVAGDLSAPRTLSRMDLVSYGLAACGSGLLLTPMTAYVPQLYAKEFGIGLGALGASLVALRVVSAFSDQFIGYFADRTRTRWGARKPWIVAGAVLTLISAYFLLRPPPMVGIMYLIIWKALYDFAYTITDISYTAWGAELSGDYDTRSRITGMRGLFNQVGNLGNDALPIVVAWLGLTATSAYSVKTLGYFFIVALFVIPITTAFSMWRAPRGAPLPAERPDLIGFLRSVGKNRPLWLYVASFSLCGIGLGSIQIIFTFYDGFLKLGAWYPYLMTVFALTLAGSVPVWTWIAQRIGKHQAYIVSVVIGSIAMQGYWFLDPSTMPQATIVGYSMVVMLFLGFGASALIVVSPAILGDIADYGRLKTGEQRTAGYYAFYMLTTQVATAIGAGGSFWMLSLFGYDARAGAVNTGHAAFGMLFAVSLFPAVIKLVGAAIMIRFPLDKRRHAIVQRRLAQLAARRARLSS